jgi:hypothetical protein
MHRRIRAFAIEKAIPTEKIAKLLKGRTTVTHVGQFCEDYGVSADWLLCGDLKGLLRTVRNRQSFAP